MQKDFYITHLDLTAYLIESSNTSHLRLNFSSNYYVVFSGKNTSQETGVGLLLFCLLKILIKPPPPKTCAPLPALTQQANYSGV